MNQTIFFANNSGAIILILMVYCAAYYYLCILYAYNLKYLPFSSSSFDEIPNINLIHT